MKISMVWMARTFRGLKLLSSTLVHYTSCTSFTSTTLISLNLAHICTIIFTYVFLTSPQGLTHAFCFLYTSHISSPTPYPLGFLFGFLFCLSSTVFELELYDIFNWFSSHVSKLRLNIFILSQSDKHPFSVSLEVYKSLFHHVVP